MIGSRTWLDFMGFMILGAFVGVAVANLFIRILEEISDFVTLHRQAHVRHLVSEFEMLLNKREKAVAASGKIEAHPNHDETDADPS